MLIFLIAWQIFWVRTTYARWLEAGRGAEFINYIDSEIMKDYQKPLEDKNLILTANPRYLNEQVDFSKTNYTQDQIISLQTSVLGLGIILPASDQAPDHLVRENSILNIWILFQITVAWAMWQRAWALRVGVRCHVRP